MKKLIPILLCFTNTVFSQESKFEYYDTLGYSGYESLVLKPDSFVYFFTWHLMRGETKGSVTKVNDTLILNSDFQAYKEIKESYNALNNDFFVVNVHNYTCTVDENIPIEWVHQVGFYLVDKKNEKEINLNNSDTVKIESDMINGIRSYYFKPEIFTRKKRLYFTLFRTNFDALIDFKSKNVNQVDIILNELPCLTDYTFFTNQKVVYTKNGITFIFN